MVQVPGLSSIHKGEILNGNSQGRSDIPDEQEQFMLQNYIKAISHLQPHFSNKDKSSVRVGLITCVVFVCLELLRGRFRTAQTHLQSGLKVLGETQNLSNVNDDSIFLLRPSRESIDNWIVEAFSRLHIQVVLFEQGHRLPCLILQVPGPEPPILIFHSLNEAWKQMERLLNEIFHLAKQVRGQRASEYLSLRDPSTEASKEGLQGRESGGMAFQLLCTYYTMANIMAEVCLWLDNELIFDSCTKQFVSMIGQMTNLWNVRLSGSQVRALPARYMNMSRSVVDVGWLPPLYYVALKCRVHQVRLQAIRLLECTSHREGIWDSKIAACVARKVMEIEERDFYRDVDTADDFPLSSSPELWDLSLPALPESYRIHEVKVVLPDGPMDSVFLFYRQRQNSWNWKALVKEFNVLRQCWMDERTGEKAEM